MKMILWDFDGTLAYRDGTGWSGMLFSLLEKNDIKNISIEDIRPHLQAGFTWHNPECSHEEIFKGKTWWEYYEQYFCAIFIKLGIDKDTGKDLSKKIKSEYMDKKKWHVYGDVIETLKKTAAGGYKNIILSNHIPELEEIVRNLNIEKYFVKIYSSGNIGYEKPNIKIYEYVLDQLQTDRHDCVIIGDSYDADIQGGMKAGIKSILVRAENKNDYRHYCKDLTNILQEMEKL